MSDITSIKSYLIYNPVYRRIKKYVKRQGHRKFIINTWNIWLNVNDDVLDMRLVWINGESKKLIELLDHLTIESNCLWATRPTLSVDELRFDLLEKFIRTNQLSPYVEKIQTQAKLAIVREKVKVITFHPRSRVQLTTFEHPKNFEKHNSLYIAKAYEWLTPAALKHFKNKNRYRNVHVVLYLLLDYYRSMRRRGNRRIFNLFDLCALRLAMFDPRYYQFDQCEIPTLIHTEIRDIIKSSGHNFSLYDYCMQQGVRSVPPAVAEYLNIVYSSNYSGFVSELDFRSIDSYGYSIKIEEYIELYTAELYEQVVIDFIRMRPFLTVIISCESLAMSQNLFKTLITLPNVKHITVSVDFQIDFDEQQLPNDMAQTVENKLFIVFIGTNAINCLSNYIAWLKPNSKCRKLTLSVECSVVDYTIFNQLPVEVISFLRHELNTELIEDFLRFEDVTSTHYQWREVTLERNFELLHMLNEFGSPTRMDIVLDENTFELIFRFVEECFQRFNQTELEFGGDFIKFNANIIPSADHRNINFDCITFRLNDDRSQIEVYHKIAQEVIDLYQFSVDIGYDSEDDEFEFYQ